MSTFNPSDLSNYVNFLNEHITKDQCLPDHYKFVRNIGYSFQYLEYLNQMLRWEGLHYTVQVLTYEVLCGHGNGHS